MRLALWTAAPAGWPAALAAAATADAEVVLVSQDVHARADLHVYQLSASPACGFVYRALLREPGLVVLEDAQLHDLVYAETVGRGVAAAYRREMRRAHGPAGAFVARQVLEGRGGALTSLTPLHARVLEACLGLVATREDLALRLRPALPGRPVAVLAPASVATAETARVLFELARAVAPHLPEARRALAAARALEATPLGRALDEIRPLARELGLGEVPGLQPRLASLFPG